MKATAFMCALGSKPRSSSRPALILNRIPVPGFHCRLREATNRCAQPFLDFAVRLRLLAQLLSDSRNGRTRRQRDRSMQTSETPGHGRSATEERILAAAASLFGRLGFNGVSTRDIAAAAEVNEVTIYRHYPRKRDLYIAVLASELGRVSLRGDLLAEIAQAADARKALASTFELITTTVTREPGMLRLVLYSSLELRADLDLLLRKHLGELVEVVARYLEPWVIKGDLRCSSAK